MSANFNQALTTAMAANISANGELAEACTVTKATGGPGRSIYGVFNRQPPQRWDATGNITTPKMTVLVQNSTSNGYSSTEIDPRDTITVAYRIGTSATVFRISLSPDRANQDAATLLLELD